MQAVYESLAIESLQGKQKKQIDLGRGEMYLTQHLMSLAILKNWTWFHTLIAMCIN